MNKRTHNIHTNLGKRNYYFGRAAENSVARAYKELGYELLHERWKSTYGEIDLILRTNAVLVFCEVKSSRNHDRALAMITPTKKTRLYRAAQFYLEAHNLDQNTDIRMDAALVDYMGTVKVIQNIFA